MKCFWMVLFLAPTFSQISGSQNATSSPCTDENHIFLAPGVLTAGGSIRACVSRFFTDGTATMTVTLDADDQQQSIAFRELPPGDGGCIDVSVPLKPNTKAKLTANIRYPEARCAWESDITVRIASGRVLAIHTERARYRPGDTLRFRILALKADLTPAHGLIEEIWLEGPRGAWAGTRAAQWQEVRTRMGVAQIQYELDELAPAGRWTVTAKLGDGTQGTAAFLVSNYELPPFQLSVKHPPKVLRTSERLVWTVCVRYPWTEAVEGMLVIRIRSAGGDGSGGVRTAVRLRAPRACHRHAAAARRVPLGGESPPDVVVADFSFQEEGTRVWQNTTVVSQIVDKHVSLEFLSKHQVIISPRLPYKLKVKATRWDDKPSANEQIRVCRSRSTDTKWPTNNAVTKWQPTDSSANSSCVNATTDEGGIARVTFSANEDGSGFYIFEASLQNDSSIFAPALHLSIAPPHRSYAALGPLRPAYSTGPTDPTISSKTYVPLYVSLNSIDKPLTVHFVVITRGGIIYRWGATTQCPMTSFSDYIPTISRNSRCHDIKYTKYDANSQSYDLYSSYLNKSSSTFEMNAVKDDTDDPDSLLDRHLLRVMLPIKVTHQMCPEGHLIAYFYHEGEFVSASKHFEMEECFNNKVELNWLSRQVSPGSTASLQINTPGPALCALTVLDSSSKWNQVSSVKEVIMTGLKKLMESHRNLTEYDATGRCFLTDESPESPSDSWEASVLWLASAGVRAAGRTARTPRCVPAAELLDDVTPPRSDFSEAWLWRLAGVGSNGSVMVSGRAPDSVSRFEASATCLSRTGIAISAPAPLQVFREFFIHADSPRRLKQGDTAIIRYRVFNYLYEPLNIEIQVLTDYHLSVGSERVVSACVGARGAVARRAELTARAAGTARLALRAHSLPDTRCGTTRTPPRSDEVIIEIVVEPEGIPQQDHKSILLCGKGSMESSSSSVSWNWPPYQPVPGTEALTVWAAGDITGPLMIDADGLVPLPRGCGEQNMARMATNLLALSLLPPTTTAAATAKEHVARGFTRQMQYVHPDGGFSAFGPADATPSTWLTAFSLKYLRKAHQILNPKLPVPPVLERAERWLLSQQMENGCFRNEGQVFHRELKGGLNEEGEMASVALTAYVVSSLGPDLPPRVIPEALSCLRAFPPGKTRSPTRVYAQALLTYAFMKIRANEEEMKKRYDASLTWNQKEVYEGLKDDEETRKLMELLKMARRTDEHMWWETSRLSTSIEATGYALLSLCAARRVGGAGGAAARWLSAHRDLTGGFVATQDTLVALEALSAWASTQPSAPANLTVKVRSGDESRTAIINPGDKVPELMKLGVSEQLDVSVEGTGCALIQATRSYNSVTPQNNTASKEFWVQVEVHTDGLFDCDSNGTNCFCAAEIEACVSWRDQFPDMALLEVQLPPAFKVLASHLYSQLTSQDPLLRRIELTPSGNRVTLYLSGARALPSAHACYRARATGPARRAAPAALRLADYYAPTHAHTQMYTIPEECPPRITHEPKDTIASDNLFNKAKSLSDSGEILITHEFSFEDIPEGIPLEDPIYETFNRDEAAYLSEPDQVNTDNINIQKHEPNNVKLEDSSHGTNIDVNQEIPKINNYIETNGNKSSIKLSLNDKESNETIKLNTYANNDKLYEIGMKNDKFNDTEIFSDDLKEDANNTVPNSTKNDAQVTDSIKPEKIVETTPNTNVNKVDFTTADHGKLDNPSLSEFHVIDSDTDLEVPTGIEGPIPAIVLPPPNFVPPVPSPDTLPPVNAFSRRYPNPPLNLQYIPYQYPTYYFGQYAPTRRYV